MGKKHVDVKMCRENAIIAEDVFSDDGVLIVSKNTFLTNYIMDKLNYFNIETIVIYEFDNVDNELGGYESHIRSFKEEYDSNVYLVKKVIVDLSKGEELDFDAIEKISLSLFHEVSYGNSAVRYINRLKVFDDYTYHHCINVGIYTALIGKWLGCDDEKMKEFAMAGILHDIGKYRIPVEVLNKRGVLTKEEVELLEKHPVFGYEMVKDDENIGTNIKDAILSHHERKDGSGYPYGLRGNRIGKDARIVAVADFYEALTSNRPYRQKVSPFEAIKIFEASGMETYDLSVAMTFFKNIVNCYIGEKVKLSDGRIGEIVYVPPYDLINPIIKIGEEIIDLSRDTDIKIESLV